MNFSKMNIPRIARDDNLKSQISQCEDGHSPPKLSISRKFGVTKKGGIRMVPMVPTGTKLYWVHQIDSATSGALCVELNKVAARMAARLFESRCVAKEYVALVWGYIPKKPPPEYWHPKHFELGWNENLRRKGGMGRKC